MIATTTPSFTPPAPRDGGDDGPIRYVNGVEVVALEPAEAPHPKTRNLVLFRNVAKALLADGTEVYVCDGPEECDFTADNVLSVNSHRTAHRPKNEYGSSYRPEVLRVIIREAKVAKRVGARNWAQQAAERLNEMQVKTLQRRPWTPAAVSSLLRQYGDAVKVRMPGPGRPKGMKDGEGKAAQAAKAQMKELVGREHYGPPLLSEIAELQVYIEHALVQVTNLRQFVEAGRYDNTPDPELVRKAAKWDQMQALMGGS